MPQTRNGTQEHLGGRAKLKFCGLTRKADIEAANEVKPDFIGFVFARAAGMYRI